LSARVHVFASTPTVASIVQKAKIKTGGTMSTTKAWCTKMPPGCAAPLASGISSVTV
jgi:hypothetical protein